MTILILIAEKGAGPRTPARASGDSRWHGSQGGRVALADRQLKVKRPQLRHKQEGEVKVPAYQILQDNGAAAERRSEANGQRHRWRDANMVERWVASAWLLTEKHFRKVIGHEHLWTLSVHLGRGESSKPLGESSVI